MSISEQAKGCLRLFHGVYENLASTESTVRTKLPSSVILDLVGRFRLWVGNIGAHRKGRASLDYKLREAPHIRIRVAELLQHLDCVLQRALQIITGQRVPWEDISDSDLESDTESELSDGHLSTELAQLASNMSEAIICLMRLSIAIRNPAPHDQFRHSTQDEVLSYEQWDVAHVKEKFPSAPEYLILRLGKAISRRRQYLHYREEHRKRLEGDIDLDANPQEPDAPQDAGKLDTAEWVNSTVASSLPPAVKAGFIAPDLEITHDDEDAASQTSYASSNNDPSKIRPPQIPEQGLNGDPFECPLCFRFTSVQHVHAWHKHVYIDLQPYVCTASDCQVPERTYESRREWFQHELQAHRKWWECIMGCNVVFQSSDELRKHIGHKHAELAHNPRTEDVVRSCARQYSMDQEACCPLCMEKQRSLTQLRHHLGKHHQQLSLFAIPPHMIDEEDENDNDEAKDPSVASNAASSSGSSDAEHMQVEDQVTDENDNNETVDGLIEELRKFDEDKYTLLSNADLHVLAASTLTDVRTSRPTAQPLQSQLNTESYIKREIPAGVPEGYLLSLVHSRYVRKEKLVALLEKLFGGDAVVEYNV